MSVDAVCDRCQKKSYVMGEQWAPPPYVGAGPGPASPWAKGRYVYTLPSGWVRVPEDAQACTEDWQHLCRDCAAVVAEKIVGTDPVA